MFITLSTKSKTNRLIMFAKIALMTMFLVVLARGQTISPNQNVMPSQGNFQNIPPNQQQMGNMLPNQMQNQLPPNGQMQNLQPMNLLDSLREIPARGLQMLNSVISNVRNMLPGMGRNGNQMFQNGRLPSNQMNGQTNLQGQNGLQLPNLPGTLGTLTNSLSQGRLPNPTDLTQSLTNSLGQLTQGLSGNGANGNGLPVQPAYN